MVRRTRTIVQENVRGGKGAVEFHHILSEEEFNAKKRQLLGI